MQKYLTQLLNDLIDAGNHPPEKMDYKLLYPDHPAADPEYEGVMDYMIEWEYAPEWKMDDLFGIEVERFPPADKLTEEQMTELVSYIIELWGDFNIQPHIPDTNPPSKVVYKVLLEYWKNKTVQYISEGWLHIEFCNYDETNCPWGYDYCTCKEIGITEKENNNNAPPPNQDYLNDDDETLPF